jgi:hypothetical protein
MVVVVILAAVAAAVSLDFVIITLLLAAGVAQEDIMALAAAAAAVQAAPAVIPVPAAVVAVAVAVAAQSAQAAEVMVAVAVAVSGLLVTQTRLGLGVRRAPAVRVVRVAVVTPHLGVELGLLPEVFMVGAARAALRSLVAVVVGAAVRCVLLVRAQPVNSPTQTCLKYILEIGRGSTATGIHRVRTLYPD